MKTAAILILCLAIAVQQATAKSSIRENVRKAAHDAKEVAKDVAHVGSDLKNAAQSATKIIREFIQDARSKIHKRSTEEKDAPQEETGKSKAPLTAEQRQQEIIDLWADKAKNRLSNSSEEVQIKCQDIIEVEVNRRSEELKKCSENAKNKNEENSKTAELHAVQNIRSALKDLKKHMCIAVNMRKFRLESKRIDLIISRMIAKDKKENDEKHVESESA